MNYNMGALSGWKRVAIGELLDFPVADGAPRAVTFDVMCGAETRVRVIEGDNDWLVAVGSGFMTVSFTTQKSVGVALFCEVETETDVEDGVVRELFPDLFIRTFVDTQVVSESLDPTFTTISPRPAGPSSEIQQLMKLQALNQKRRDQQFASDMAAMRARLERAERAAANSAVSDPVDNQKGNDHA